MVCSQKYGGKKQINQCQLAAHFRRNIQEDVKRAPLVETIYLLGYCLFDKVCAKDIQTTSFKLNIM